jgi:uridylate kinase
MEKKVVVFSLGGSMIIPDQINNLFLKKFKRIILNYTKYYKFVIVCGGGSIARKYINALKQEKAKTLFQSFAGISATRMNARFMSYFFNEDPKRGIPHTLKTLEKYLKKEDIVFCGALEYRPNSSSDSTATAIASHFKTEFINITNVQGLHDKNPFEHKDAKFIPKITWKKFYKMATKKKFSPGQHFILDQTAAGMIMKHKIKTYIIGPSLKDLEKLLNGKKFMGTTIDG